jgi:hypothetical protein
MDNNQFFLFPELESKPLIKDIDYVDLAELNDYNEHYGTKKNKLNQLPKQTYFLYKTGGNNPFMKNSENDFPYVKNIKENSILTPSLSKTYMQLIIKHNDIGYQISMHRHTASAFVVNDNPELKKVVNHINGNRIDYRVHNLEWSTQANNLKGCKKPRGFSKEANIFYEQGS